MCRNCGVVFGPEIVAHEARAYTPEEIRNRENTAVAWPHYGSWTRIGITPRTKNRAKWNRLERYNRSNIGKESNHANGFDAFRQIKRQLNFRLPGETEDFVMRVYKTCSDEGLVEGRSAQVFVTTLIYNVLSHVGRSNLDDLVNQISGVTARKVYRCKKLITQKPKISALLLPPKMGEERVRSVVAFIVARLDISPEEMAQLGAESAIIVDDAYEGGSPFSQGSCPSGIAAAIVYLAVKALGFGGSGGVTQKMICDVAGVTPPTLRKNRGDLLAKCPQHAIE